MTTPTMDSNATAPSSLRGTKTTDATATAKKADATTTTTTTALIRSSRSGGSWIDPRRRRRRGGGGGGGSTMGRAALLLLLRDRHRPGTTMTRCSAPPLPRTEFVVRPPMTTTTTMAE
jgi:hypothetical protein